MADVIFAGVIVLAQCVIGVISVAVARNVNVPFYKDAPLHLDSRAFGRCSGRDVWASVS